MELLVKEEVELQLAALQARAPQALRQINTVELLALAMNHLPSLYATSKKGLRYQRQVGKTQYAPQVKDVVHRALATVLNDPLRTAEPLPPQAVPQIEPMADPLPAVAAPKVHRAPKHHRRAHKSRLRKRARATPR